MGTAHFVLHYMPYFIFFLFWDWTGIGALLNFVKTLHLRYNILQFPKQGLLESEKIT